jgi:hypothetical protein
MNLLSNLDVLVECVVSSLDFLGIEYILWEENANCAGVLVVLIADVVVGCIKQETTRPKFTRL